MGLLDGFLGKDWNDPQSSAVLALAGGLLSGNFGQGAKDYGNILAGAKDTEMKRKLIEMQMQEGQMRNEALRQQFADQTKMRDLAAQYRTPATPAMPGGLSADAAGALPPEMQIGGTVKPMAARPAGFDREGYGAALEGINPELGLSYLQKIQKDEAPIKLSAGEQLFSGARGGYKPLLSVPAKPESKPSALQEYEYARGQGYAGTFDQWDKDRRRAGASTSTVSVNTGQKGLDNEMKFSAAFKGEPIYKAHQEVQSAHSQITQALKLQSPAGDLAGATKMMKILDPGSVVRESELGMAMAASGALDRLTNYSDRILKGTKLTPTQRTDFQNLANNLYDESVKQYNNKRTEYHGFAGKYGLESDVLLGKPATAAEPAKTEKPKGNAPVPMKGMVIDGYRFKGGAPGDRANWEKQ